MNTKTFLTRTSALVAGKGVQDGLKFLLLLWLARTDQSGFGLFVFGTGVAILIRSMLGLGLDQFTVRELTQNHGGRGLILGRMVRLKAIVGLLVLGCILTFGRLKGWSHMVILVVLIISTGQILEGVADSFFSIYRAEGRQIQEAVCSSTAHLFGAIYGAVVLLFGWGVVAVSFFVVVSNGLKIILAAGLGTRVSIIPRLGRGVSIFPKGQVASLLMVVAFNSLGSFYNQVQVFLLKQFKSLGDLALYGAAGELAGGLASLMSSFIIGGVIYPSLTRTAPQGSVKFDAVIRIYFWRMAAFGLGTAFFFCSLGGALLHMVFGKNYIGSIVPLQILGLATLFSFINNFLIHALLAQQEERLLLWLHIVPTVMSLLLGGILIPRLGPAGAALNLLGSRAIMSLLILTGAQMRYGLFTPASVTSFLWGGVILGIIYFGLLALMAPLQQLPAVLALLGYTGWTWRSTKGPGKAWPEEGAPKQKLGRTNEDRYPI